MVKFINYLTEMKYPCQVFIGITLKDESIKSLISKLNKDLHKIIIFNDRAIRPCNEMQVKTNFNTELNNG